MENNPVFLGIKKLRSYLLTYEIVTKLDFILKFRPKQFHKIDSRRKKKKKKKTRQDSDNEEAFADLVEPKIEADEVPEDSGARKKKKKKDKRDRQRDSQEEEEEEDRPLEASQRYLGSK
jgi:hypothetical protein